MSKIKFTYYPGCSSMESGKHLDESVRAITAKLDIELDEIADWNCCGASVGHVKTGPLPTYALSGRNLAKAREQGPFDVISPCAACYLNTHGVNERIKHDVTTRQQVNEALSAAGLAYEGDLHVRHVCEVLVNEVGDERIKHEVKKPLSGLPPWDRPCCTMRGQNAPVRLPPGPTRTPDSSCSPTSTSSPLPISPIPSTLSSAPLQT